MRQLNLRAMAKINLGLDVTGKREDGYHDLRMVMQTVRLFDSISLSVTRSEGVRMRTNLGFLPTDDGNLAVRAAKLLMEEFQVEEGVFIDLKKRIPVAAGLAGGSSDAAAVLVGVNRLFHLQLTQEELRERGVKLGADIPFCIIRGTALAEGIGDILTPVASIPPCVILIAKPDLHVSTKFVYTHLELTDSTVHPDIDGQIRCLEAGDLRGMCSLCGNVLETVTERAYPVISDIKKRMRDHGALAAMMSGSGPSVFGIYEKQEDAQKAASALRDEGYARMVCVTEPFYAGGRNRAAEQGV